MLQCPGATTLVADAGAGCGLAVAVCAAAGATTPTQRPEKIASRIRWGVADLRILIGAGSSRYAHAARADNVLQAVRLRKRLTSHADEFAKYNDRRMKIR